MNSIIYDNGVKIYQIMSFFKAFLCQPVCSLVYLFHTCLENMHRATDGCFEHLFHIYLHIHQNIATKQIKFICTWANYCNLVLFFQLFGFARPFRAVQSWESKYMETTMVMQNCSFMNKLTFYRCQLLYLHTKLIQDWN